MKVDTAALRAEIEKLPDVDRDFIGWYELGEDRRQKVLAMIAELDLSRSIVELVALAPLWARCENQSYVGRIYGDPDCGTCVGCRIKWLLVELAQ